MDILEKIDQLAAERLSQICGAVDDSVVKGRRYYVSAQGDDNADGLTPKTAWKTIQRVNSAEFDAGDGVFFRRGDVFRGGIIAREGVTYAAYGEGPKPRLYGWQRDLADSALWTEEDTEKHIWKYTEPILDVGTLVFDDGKAWSRKLIPSYINGGFVCRDDEACAFDMRQEMTQNLDIYWHYDARMTVQPSKGQDFPIPLVDDQSYGELYLRCDSGNPGLLFSHIEALTKRCMFRVGSKSNVHIENLCIKYVGHHAISAGGHVKGLHVKNCEIGWIGGTIQHYLGTDPNYPQGGRGTVTRFGNAVEIYGGCEDYLVENCYIYQCYDAGITHQITTTGKKIDMSHIRYLNNLVERCVYSIEYFLEMPADDRESCMSDVLISGNILRLCGYGWGQQRHNIDTPAHIKGWSYVNRARNFKISNNVFDRSAYRMLHLVARESESCPTMCGNTYIQQAGAMLGQYGSNEQAEPDILLYDECAEQYIHEILKDREARVYYTE